MENRNMENRNTSPGSADRSATGRTGSSEQVGSLAGLRIETELNAVIRLLQQGAMTPKISIW